LLAKLAVSANRPAECGSGPLKRFSPLAEKTASEILVEEHTLWPRPPPEDGLPLAALDRFGAKGSFGERCKPYMSVLPRGVLQALARAVEACVRSGCLFFMLKAKPLRIWCECRCRSC